MYFLVVFLFFCKGGLFLFEKLKKVLEVWICILFIVDIYIFILKCFGLEFGRGRNCNKKCIEVKIIKKIYDKGISICILCL